MVSPLCVVYVQLVQTKPISNVFLCMHYLCVQVATHLLPMALVSIGYHLHMTYDYIAPLNPFLILNIVIYDKHGSKS